MNFDSFQKRQKQFAKAEQELNTQFIFNGYPSVKIINGSERMQAVVVNKQESEEAYIYTTLNKPLKLGSVWEAKGLHFIVADEITIMKDVNWHKYYCYLANVNVKDSWYFFYGPKKSKINVSLKQNVFLESSQTPVLVTPGAPLKLGDKIMIGERAWLVQEYDNISSKGVTYYTIRESTISKDAASIRRNSIEKRDTTQLENLEEVYENGELTPVIYVAPDTPITLPLDRGMFACNNKNDIKIIKRSNDILVFSVNYNVDRVSITTEDKTYTYTTIPSKE